MSDVLRILSLGAGVQSTTVDLMAIHGELEPFHHVIFADTGWEPAGVYEHLGKLQAEHAKRGLPPIEVVTVGNIRDDHLAPASEHLFIRKPRKHPEWLGKQRTFIPFFVQNAPTVKNPSGKGKTFRTCTKTYKIEPVEQLVREKLGLRRNQAWPLERVVDQSMGISWDEATRVRVSGRPAIQLVYPLIESEPGLTDRRMTRNDCHRWLAAHGWTAPRSACIGCPFHRNDEWRRIRDNAPDEWKDAVEFDAVFRERVEAGLTPLEGTPYLHDSRVPLSEADIDHDEPVDDQLSFFADTLFGADCEGLCGT